MSIYFDHGQAFHKDATLDTTPSTTLLLGAISELPLELVGLDWLLVVSPMAG